MNDGKSTPWIGRLLYDSNTLYQDQLAQLEADSKKFGTQGQNIEFAHEDAGLLAELDFRHHHRRGISILPPTNANSLSQIRPVMNNTRNMITGASTVQLAVIVIDARKGISESFLPA